MAPNLISFNTEPAGPTAESIPERTGNINKIHIREKFKQLGVNIDDLKLGDFDQIGEMTAKKRRDPGTDLYNNVGAFFRPNYERGLLIYTLIRKYNLKSYLEVGFGRGYSCLCAAFALSENGGGSIVTVDPNLNEDFLNNLAKSCPKDWFSMIRFINGKSQEFLADEKQANEKYDLIYIDGDHTYAATKRDWELCKDKYNNFLIFDDYHLPGKVQKDIECSNLIDQIEDDSKELIIMDRRIFLDDRGYTDDQIDYGQVLITK